MGWHLQGPLGSRNWSKMDTGECIHFGVVDKDGIELVRTGTVFHRALMRERKEACPGLVMEPRIWRSRAMSGWKQTQSWTVWDRWVPVPSSPFKSDVTSSKLFNLSEPWFTHLQKGDHKTICLLDSCGLSFLEIRIP